MLNEWTKSDWTETMHAKVNGFYYFEVSKSPDLMHWSLVLCGKHNDKTVATHQLGMYETAYDAQMAAEVIAGFTK